MKKLRYRIKRNTFGNGTIKYSVQLKTLFGWDYLTREAWFVGEYSEPAKVDTREEALSIIDMHYERQRAKAVVSMEIEYITK